MKPRWDDGWSKMFVGDATDVLSSLPEKSVHCCVTSPPYFGLRSYLPAEHPDKMREGGTQETPEAYVEWLVGVFRGVWRVLRDDGTVWLNLGDRFLPNKQLAGMPWRVAQALRESFYTGRLKNEAHRVWLAAAIDGEGCMFIHRRKVGQSNGQGYYRKNDTYGAGLEVANTSERFVKRCMEITGMGSICRQDKGRKQRLYRWNLRSSVCREIVREVYPYLVAKQHEARLLLGCPSSGSDAIAAHAALMSLHNGGLTDVDFAPPASLYSPGWYLRSAITWCKLNPMPESVTDRPTQATEMVYLFSKKPRYFYDAEAVKEKYSENTHGGNYRHGGPKVNEVHKLGKPNPGSPAGEQPGSGCNLRNYWSISTRPYKNSHYAVFPPELPERCIKAGTSEKGVCSVCLSPWKRVVERTGEISNGHKGSYFDRGKTGSRDGGDRTQAGDRFGLRTVGWEPTCEHAAEVVPATVLDPFSGSGTTGLVARKLGRKSVLIDLDDRNVKLLEERMGYQGVLL